MQGHGFKSIVAENVQATRDALVAKYSMGKKKKMCWRCQKDKSPVGGHIKTFAGGPMKFICKECLDAKKEKADDKVCSAGV